MCISHPPGEAGNILAQVLEDCICSMSGEKCELNVELQDASLGSVPGSPTAPTVPGAPNGSNKVVYSVLLLSFGRGKDVWNLSNQERVELAKHHKTLGTDFFLKQETSKLLQCIILKP